MKKDAFPKIITLAMIALIVLLCFKAKSRRNTIDNYGKSTICKLTLCKQHGKSSTAFVKYYVNGKRYRTDIGGCPDDPGAKVGSFFAMKYNKEDPTNIIVDFSSTIKDSILIKELEEKIKFSMFDE